jgi:hypothetical protein
VEGDAMGLTRLEQVTKTINEGRSYMKRFLGILVASMFLGSAGYAAESGPAPESRGSKEDRKVGFEGEQKTPDKKTKSDVKSGSVPESRGSKEDRKVGFEGEQKTPDKK